MRSTHEPLEDTEFSHQTPTFITKTSVLTTYWATAQIGPDPAVLAVLLLRTMFSAVDLTMSSEGCLLII